MREQAPNVLTLSNLFCGCCALAYIFTGDPETAAWFTLGSFVCDYADGMLARAMGVQSPLGKELDSLADVVSFGVVPAAYLYFLLTRSICASGGLLSNLPYFSVCKAALPAFILAGFAAYRLGKFNLDTRQGNYFLGLSTPACTVFILGLTLGAVNDRFGLQEEIQRPVFLYALVPALAALMVSEIPMFGLKFKGLQAGSNVILLLFLALFVGLILFLKELALSAIVLIYILFSIIFKSKVTAV